LAADWLFLWANALENAPIPSSATAIAATANRAAIRTRKLKKADCEVDFFFIDGVELVRSALNPQRYEDAR
jgi:hypothetical protein